MNKEKQEILEKIINSYVDHTPSMLVKFNYFKCSFDFGSFKIETECSKN